MRGMGLRVLGPLLHLHRIPVIEGSLTALQRDVQRLLSAQKEGAAPATSGVGEGAVGEGAVAALPLPNGPSYRLTVPGTQDAYVEAVLNNGMQEPDWQLCMALLRPGDTFFDLGANIGVFSVPAAALGAKVHACELLVPNIQTLTQSLGINGLADVRVVLGAVGDANGAVGFVGTSAWGRVDPQATTYVATVRIDDYAGQHGIGRVDLMKVDVEGSERGALLGAAATLNRDHPDVLIEANALTCGEAGYSYRELLRLLAGWGYALHRVGAGVLHPWAVETVQEVVQTDYLATVKTPDEISRRSGWPVAAMTVEQVTENVVRQDIYNDYHRMHLLAVEGQLPPEVRAEPRVNALFQRWQPLRTREPMIASRTGSAP